MQEFEKLGMFYLGRPYDLLKKTPKPGWLLYDSKDLVTHAVCVGMTGSGKTGLCIGLIEEAAIDGIPALVIDPKGDLANLLLSFPQLRGEDFLSWINEDEAQKKGLSPQDYADQQAKAWEKGLAMWGQNGDRISRLHKAADFTIYTPGSTAGFPISILNSFAAPPDAVIQDVELLRERIGTTVISLLSLLGIEEDPIQSREHILISTLLETAWQQGQDMNLPSLIQHIQSPPFSKVGVLDMESFYPSKDRFTLAMRLNNLLAAPGFSVWLEGVPLDLDQLLYTPEGKPRVAIFSIAHLNDTERMFFVTLLLGQTISWMRAQSGTTSLRALVYMDEVFGYFPPVANPPSKAPLLTMLKQARAFGVGIVLATQNPVDLDYKGLSNAGTWFIGRLQTEQDKARLLDGLEGATAGTSGGFKRQQMEEILSGLGSRIFLLHNVHDDAPEVFETRWALSYLRGPLTRNQIKTLMERKKAVKAASEIPAVRSGSGLRNASPGNTLIETSSSQRPVLPVGISQYFVPIRGEQPAESTLVYHPMLLASASVRFVHTKTQVEASRDLVFLASINDQAITVDWDSATEVDLLPTELEQEAPDGSRYAELPPAAAKPKNYAAWSKKFVDWLYRHQSLQLWESSQFKQISRPGESERDFRIRLQQLAHEQRDEASDRLRQKYASKTTTLQDRIRRAEQAQERETEQAKQQHFQTAISFGATLLGAFLGRKTVSTSTLGRAATAVRSVSRSIKESKDISRAKENVEVLRQRLADLEAQFEADSKKLFKSYDPVTEPLKPIVIRPKKTNISVKLVTLAWLPHWRNQDGTLIQAWQ